MNVYRIVHQSERVDIMAPTAGDALNQAMDDFPNPPHERIQPWKEYIGYRHLWEVEVLIT